MIQQTKQIHYLTINFDATSWVVLSVIFVSSSRALKRECLRRYPVLFTDGFVGGSLSTKLFTLIQLYCQITFNLKRSFLSGWIFISNIQGGGGWGGVLHKNWGGGVRHDSWNPYRPYFRPKYVIFPTLFETWPLKLRGQPPNLKSKWQKSGARSCKNLYPISDQ